MKAISIESVLNTLVRFNTWWQLGGTRGKLPEVRRTAFYNVQRLMRTNQVVFLQGPHLVGKTTVILQLIQSLLESGVAPERIIYIPMDRAIFRFFPPREILRVYHDNVYAANDTFHFFDDTQCGVSWAAWEKAICGSGRDRAARVVAAGTMLPLEEPPVREYPVTLEEMPPMSFFEYCQMYAGDELPSIPEELLPCRLSRFSRQEQTALLMRMNPLRKHFARYIQVGGYPGIQTSDQSVRQFHDAVKKTLYLDIASARNVRHISDMEQVFLLLCFQNPDVVSLDNISRELIGISRKTVEKYVRLLADAGLIYISMPVPLGGQQLQKIQPKIYISDFALKNAIYSQSRLQVDYEGLNGSIEVSAFRQLRSFYAGTDVSIGYSRHAARHKQINIVADDPRGRIFLDIRYQEDSRISRSDLSRALASQAKEVFVLTKKENDFGPIPEGPENLYRIPAHAFLYILGHYDRHRRDVRSPAARN
ncbi:MAG: ATP-binding protein [Oscillospiraceae bacterium]|nr:ATP-binding protein [Oscillospiraceae bacterium]